MRDVNLVAATISASLLIDKDESEGQSEPRYHRICAETAGQR